MRHIKIYEQFDELDPFEEETKNNDSFRIGKYDNVFYIIRIRKDKYYLFDGNQRCNFFNLIDFNTKPETNDIVWVDDENNVYDGNINPRFPNWKYFEYRDLPKEIKDRIV